MATPQSVIDSIEKLKIYSSLGEKKTENGSTLIGKAPHIAPYAWLNTIYSPLSDEQILELEKQIDVKVPDCYKSFLKISNGLQVLHSLSLYGLRFNFKRTIEEAEQQPFSIITPNTLEKPKNAGKNIFYIGGYSSGDGAWLYIDLQTNIVHLCKKWKVKSLYQWSSFEVMLSSEIERLLQLFDKNGKKLNPNKNTLPISI
ncbi:MAG TPA: SMI1/KNR4 family protein [Parafilimonas sp.]|nr:SMI1/KNR4 family protein [Parafilimonas sp.]